MSTPAASGTIEVGASAAHVYAIVTDLDALAALAEEAESMQWTSGSAAAPGSVFTGKNRNGLRRWSTTCTVTDADPGHCFAFEVTSGPLKVARWQYDVEVLADDRCRVTESTWDRRPGWFKVPGGLLTGVMDRATASKTNIDATLARLKTRAEA